MSEQAASHMTGGERMLQPGKTVSGRKGFGTSHLGIHFYHAPFLTAWGSSGLWSGPPSPRMSEGQMV